MLDRTKSRLSFALIAAATLARFFSFNQAGEQLHYSKSGTAGHHATKKRTTRAQRKRTRQLRRSAQQVQRRLSWSRA